MRICKEAMADTNCLLDENELGLINALSRSPLKAEEVYTFAVCLCDNEVDRDNERFDIPALQGLAELFVDKAGIFTTSGPPRARPPAFTAPSWYRTKL